MKEKSYMPWIDFLKGVTMLFVMYEHTNAYYWRIGNVLCTYAMPLYFIISGYMTGQKTPDGKFSLYIKGRARRLLVPYAVYSIFLVAIKAVIDLIQSTNVKGLQNYLIGVLYGRYMLFDTESVNDPTNIHFLTAFNGTLWFILALFLASLLFRLYLIIYKRNNGFGALFLAFIFITSVASTFLPVLLPWSIDVLGVITVFMAVGYEYRKREHTSKLWPAFLMGGIYVILCYLNGGNNISVRKYGVFKTASMGIYVLAGTVATLALMIIVRYLYENGKKRFILASAFEYIGKHSITFMCTQILFIEIVEMVGKKYISNRFLLGGIELTVAVIFCFLVSFVFDRLGKKYSIFKLL